jgi:hypothetical protein
LWAVARGFLRGERHGQVLEETITIAIKARQYQGKCMGGRQDSGAEAAGARSELEAKLLLVMPCRFCRGSLAGGRHRNQSTPFHSGPAKSTAAHVPAIPSPTCPKRHRIIHSLVFNMDGPLQTDNGARGLYVNIVRNPSCAMAGNTAAVLCSSSNPLTYTSCDNSSLKRCLMPALSRVPFQLVLPGKRHMAGSLARQ